MPEKMKPIILEVTPQQLLADHHSAEARRLIDMWYMDKANGTITTGWACGDARVPLSSVFGMAGVATIRTIAASPGVADFPFLFAHQMSNRFVALGHFDGSKPFQNGVPSGCGGLDARRQHGHQLTRSHDPIINIGDYIRHGIASFDVTTQVLMTSLYMAGQTQHPVLAALVDHTSYQVYPIALVSSGGNNITSNFNLFELLSDPAKIYAKGVPCLDEQQLPPKYQALLELNRARRQQIINPTEFQRSQSVQDPPVARLTTSIRPAAVTYPKTFGEPNTVFNIIIPYKQNGHEVAITEDIARAGIAQIEYPLSHVAKAKQGQPFASTKALLVKTPSMGISQHIAQAVTREPWFDAWQKKGGKILVAELGAKGAVNNIIQYNV